MTSLPSNGVGQLGRKGGMVECPHGPEGTEERACDPKLVRPAVVNISHKDLRKVGFTGVSK